MDGKLPQILLCLVYSYTIPIHLLGLPAVFPFLLCKQESESLVKYDCREKMKQCSKAKVQRHTDFGLVHTEFF